MLDKGIDPFSKAPSSNPYPTFRDAVETYIADDPKDWKDPKAANHWRNTLQKHAYPVIKNKTLDVITNVDIARILKPIWRPRFPTATKVRSRIEIIWDYSVPSNNTLRNPARYEGYLKKQLPKRDEEINHLRSLDWTDARDFFAMLTEMKGEAARALMWSILTVTRSATTYKMKWQEVDFSKQLWNCPAENMKNKRRGHQVPLFPELLDFLGPIGGPKKPVFPNTRSGRHLSDAALLTVIKRMGYHKQTTVHGFRSIFTDWARNKPEPATRDVLDEVLTHRKESSVYAAYARSDLLEKRRTLHREWAEFLGFVESPNALKFGDKADFLTEQESLDQSVSINYNV